MNKKKYIFFEKSHQSHYLMASFLRSHCRTYCELSHLPALVTFHRINLLWCWLTLLWPFIVHVQWVLWCFCVASLQRFLLCRKKKMPVDNKITIPVHNFHWIFVSNLSFAWYLTLVGFPLSTPSPMQSLLHTLKEPYYICVLPTLFSSLEWPSFLATLRSKGHQCEKNKMLKLASFCWDWNISK